MIKHFYRFLSFFTKHYVNIILKCEHELSCFIITLIIIIAAEYAVFHKCNSINIQDICFNYELIILLDKIIDK